MSIEPRDVDTGSGLDLFRDRDDGARQLRNEPRNTSAIPAAVVDDGDAVDVDVVDRRDDLVNQLRQHVEHEDPLPVGARSLVLLGQALEHLDLGLAVLDDLRCFRLGGKLLSFEVRLRRRDDIGFETTALEFDPLLLEILLGRRTGDVASDLRFLFLRLGDRLEFGGPDRSWFCSSTMFLSACTVAIWACSRADASAASDSAIRSASATRACFTTSAVSRRPTESRYWLSSVTFWIFITSSSRPRVLMSSSASSINCWENLRRSSLTSSGDSVASTPRRLASRFPLQSGRSARSGDRGNAQRRSRAAPQHWRP